MHKKNERRPAGDKKTYVGETASQQAEMKRQKKDKKLDSKAAITNTIQVAIYVSWKQVPKGGKNTESSYRTCREGSHCLVPVTELNIKIQSETKWCKIINNYVPSVFL